MRNDLALQTARPIGFVITLILSAPFLIWIHVRAGERPLVDLSLEVSVSPAQFTPGGRSTVTLRVHNSGPDTAGATLPNQESIFILEDPFDVTEGPPPFEIVTNAVGCRADEIVPDPVVSVWFVFDFEEIPAGQSRSCTFDIEFYPSTQEDFPTGWQVFTPNDDDSDPSNDRVDYVFQVASPAAANVRTLSWLGASLLGVLLLMIAALNERSARDAAAQRDNY